jgi:hypothetical protein
MLTPEVAGPGQALVEIAFAGVNFRPGRSAQSGIVAEPTLFDSVYR